MVFYVGVASTYYKQLLDPTFQRAAPTGAAANLSAPPPSYPEHYNPPYLGYDVSAPPYAPPSGPPPMFKEPRGSYDDISLSAKDDRKGEDPFADFDRDRDAKSREALV